MVFNHGIHRMHGTLVSLVVLFGVAVSAVAAEPGITVEARQRYPWNGLVDLKFTITGESGTKYDTSFTAKDMVGGTNIALKTIRKSNGVAAEEKEKLLPGTYNWIWDAAADLPKGFKCDRVTVTGTSVEPDRTYMVVDLTSGAITYLDSVPSGGWGNTYKSTLLVLRKIPTSGNVKEFYIGIFEVTQAQWTKLSMSNSSRYKSSYYPVENMTGWNARQYIANLRTLTGVVYFCFPSDAQWLVAANSGPGGSKSADTEYVVGSLAANSIGIYDLKGNVQEWVRYSGAYSTLGSYYGGSGWQLLHWNEVGSHTSNGYMGPTASDMYLGLRVAYSQSDYKSSNGSGGYD